MTNYTDLPQASSLYAESERTQQAVTNIDAGAVLLNFTIGAIPMPVNPPPQSPTGLVAIPAPSMPITITLDAPASDALMGDLRTWLVQHLDDITNKLSALEVTNTPAPIPPATRKA